MLNPLPVPRRERTIVLAAMTDGSHVQIGEHADHDAAAILYLILDSEQAGWTRDASGHLRRDAAAQHDHYIGGQRVRFYRLRQHRAPDIIPTRIVNPGRIAGRG